MVKGLLPGALECRTINGETLVLSKVFIVITEARVRVACPS
jgi:hypothetical protein